MQEEQDQEQEKLLRITSQEAKNIVIHRVETI